MHRLPRVLAVVGSLVAVAGCAQSAPELASQAELQKVDPCSLLDELPAGWTESAQTYDYCAYDAGEFHLRLHLSTAEEVQAQADRKATSTDDGVMYQDAAHPCWRLTVSDDGIPVTLGRPDDDTKEADCPGLQEAATTVLASTSEPAGRRDLTLPPELLDARVCDALTASPDLQKSFGLDGPPVPDTATGRSCTARSGGREVHFSIEPVATTDPLALGTDVSGSGLAITGDRPLRPPSSGRYPSVHSAGYEVFIKDPIGRCVLGVPYRSTEAADPAEQPGLAVYGLTDCETAAPAAGELLAAAVR